MKGMKIKLEDIRDQSSAKFIVPLTVKVSFETYKLLEKFTSKEKANLIRHSINRGIAEVLEEKEKELQAV